MNALHQALENGAELYYKPKRIALVYLRYKIALDITLTLLAVGVFMLILITWIAWGFDVARWVVFGLFVPLYVVMAILATAANQERRMLEKVIAMATAETGIELTPLVARPMVHQIIGYLFAQKVVEENK